MVWYYKVGDQENGPVSKAELQSLIKSNDVNAQSLVRSVEMDNWFPLIDVIRGKVGKTQSPPPPPNDTILNEMETAEAVGDDDLGALTMEEKPVEAPRQPLDQGAMAMTTGSESTGDTAVCSQCGRIFPEDQVITFEDKMICAACKPLFVQKIKEGVAPGALQHFGGFWIRFVAKFIDGIILGIGQWAILIPVSMLVAPSMMEGGDQALSPNFFMFIGIQVLLGISIPLLYNTFFLGRWGATLGKMACGLKVVTPEGGDVTYMRAFGRFFAEWISMIILYIGYIMVGFDDEKRSLHDRICSTRVVKKR
jgi:uncharacterized RDD family membrane protein YckC